MLLLDDHRPLASSVVVPRLDAIDRARELGQRLFDGAGAADENAEISDQALATVAASGLPLAVFSRVAGGEGLLGPERAGDLARILRLVGGGDLSVARLFEGHVNAVALVERYGTPAQAAGLADAVRAGVLSGVWNAEGRRSLTATPHEDGWRLEGEKILASGAGIIRHPIVTPRTPDGPLMLVLDLERDERADLAGWRPQGMRASATGTIRLDGVVVPRSAEIGASGEYLRQPAFSGGAWRFCAVHLGAAERLLDLYRAHLVARSRDGDPYQRQRIAACAAAVTTAALWIEKAAAMVALQAETPEQTVAFVNLTRMVTERSCLDVMEAIHRGIGLGAFIRPDPVERISRDLATYLRQPVPDAAMVDAATFVLGSGNPSHDLWGL